MTTLTLYGGNRDGQGGNLMSDLVMTLKATDIVFGGMGFMTGPVMRD